MQFCPQNFGLLRKMPRHFPETRPLTVCPKMRSRLLFTFCQKKRTFFFTEICDFDVESLVEQEVLGLEIPVYDVVTVAILDARDDLLEEPAGVGLLQL